MKMPMELSLLRQHVIAKRDAARAEAQALDDFLRRLDEMTKNLVAVAGSITVSLPLDAPYGLGTPAPMKRGRGRLHETETAAVEVIHAAGRPVPTPEMLIELAKRGVEVGGKDPSSTLSARLSRAESIENVRPYGWRLREPRQDIGTEDPALRGEPSAADPVTQSSSPVEPAAGGGI